MSSSSNLSACRFTCNRLFRLDSIALQDLEIEPLIAISEHAHPEIHKEIVAYCRVLRINLNVVGQPFTFHKAIRMALSGKGIAMVSSRWSRLTKEGIVFRPLAPPVGFGIKR